MPKIQIIRGWQTKDVKSLRSENNHYYLVPLLSLRTP